MRLIALSALAALAACTPADPTDPADDGDTDPVDEADPTGLSAAEAEDLLFLREEEKLARDVYGALYDTHGAQIFSNIGASEQRHMDALLVEIERLGLEDPVVDDARGAFTVQLLTDLYAQLTADGAAGLVAGLTAGATIEDLDIVDLHLAADATDDPALQAAYALLECGSRNHLRGFTSQLAAQGGSYSPQYLDQAAYDAILAGGHEACGEH